MLAFLRGLPNDASKHKLPTSFRKDLMWWDTYLVQYNGVSMMAVENWSKPDSVMACDACLPGAGGVCDSQVFHCVFHKFVADQNLHINALELLTIMVCVKLWSRRWRGLRIQINCDNQSSVLALNSGHCKDVLMQSCLREILYVAAVHEFEVRGVHIPGITNRLPDLLSRWDVVGNRVRFAELTKGEKVDFVSVSDKLFRFTHTW